VNFGFDHSAAA